MRAASQAEGSLGVARGAAVYVGAVMGPSVLPVPALAVQIAGPASVIAWGALVALSVPLAVTFAALGVLLPVTGGVAAYARSGLGAAAGAMTGVCFVAAVVIGTPAVALIGGFYVSDLVGGGGAAAALVGLAMFGGVLALNTFGLRVSTGAQLVLSTVLVVVLATAVTVAVPHSGARHWHPFLAHGWGAVGLAASVLTWLFVGWEAAAQLASELADPARDLPAAMSIAFCSVSLLYLGLAFVTVGTGASGASRVPLADLLTVDFGSIGRRATAALAVAVTVGTMNVYQGSAARLLGALAEDGSLPGWIVEPQAPPVPRRPLGIVGAVGIAVLGALSLHLVGVTALVRTSSACSIAVYVLTTTAALRLLAGRARLAAATALALVCCVGLFSAWFLVAPLALSSAAVLVRRRPR